MQYDFTAILRYSGAPIFPQTSKGNENLFKKLGLSSRYQGNNYKGNDFWFEMLGGLRNHRVKKSGFHSIFCTRFILI